jgi:hypothetical protein
MYDPVLGRFVSADSVVSVSADYNYYANSNLTAGAGRTYTWTAKSLPSGISHVSGSESYDADGERIKNVAGSATTVYLKGLWEEVSAVHPRPTTASTARQR